MMKSYLPSNWESLNETERLDYKRSADNLLDRLRGVITLLESYQDNNTCNGWKHLHDQLDTLLRVTQLSCAQLETIIDQTDPFAHFQPLGTLLHEATPFHESYTSPFTGKSE